MRHGFEVELLCPTFVANALAFGQLCLNIDQLCKVGRFGLYLGFALCVCLQRGKHCRLIELVTEMFRSDELRSARGQIAELSTAFLDGDAILLQEPVGKFFKARGTVQYRRNLSP